MGQVIDERGFQVGYPFGWPNGEYDQKDICLGVPVIIGRNSWEKILDFQLNETEQTAFNKTAGAVRSMNDVLKTL